MNLTTSELYDRYCDFWDRLEDDVRKADDSLTDEELTHEWGLRLSFGQFEQLWHEVCEEPELEERWLRRLIGGYDQARHELDRSLHQSFGKRPSISD